MPFTRAIAMLAALMLSSGAFAAAQRTFVSTSGSDANAASSCSLVLPCRGFAAAIGVTTDGGEVIVLDSGGYGSVTIAKSVAIRAPAGTYAGISVFSGDGVGISGAGISVTLQGLSIVGLGGLRGIHFLAGAAVRVERCAISGFTGTGSVGLRAIAAAGALRVSDTAFSGNSQALTVSALDFLELDRTRIEDSAATHAVVVDNVRKTVIRESSIVRTGEASTGAASGLNLHATAAGAFQFLISETLIAESRSAGVLVSSGGGAVAITGTIARSSVLRSDVSASGSGAIRLFEASGTVDVAVTDSVIADNVTAGLLTATPGTSLTVSRSTVVNNGGVGFSAGAGSRFYSRADNMVRGNNGQDITGQTSGTITTLTAQ